MDNNESRRKKRGKARERQAARLRRRGVAPDHKSERNIPHINPRFSLPVLGEQEWLGSLVQKVRYHSGVLLSDAWWYLRRNPIIARVAGLIIFIVVILYFLSYLFSGRILPNVSAMGIDLGGMSSREAEDALLSNWHNDLQIELIVEGEVVGTISPSLLGMRFDAEATVDAARGGGLKAVPFGREITPVIEITSHLDVQSYLLDLAMEVDIAPFSAGYELRAGDVVGIEGRYGRMLDIPLTIEQIVRNPGEIINRGRLELLMLRLEPDEMDPSPYLDDVRMLLAQSPQLTGYDPYSNKFFTWPVAFEDYVNWLAVGPTSLTLREDAFMPFFDAMNSTLNSSEENLRYLAPTETINILRDAIANNQATAILRVRYAATSYEVVREDTGFKIGRKTGIPFFLIDEANSGVDLESINPGDIVNIPSRDFILTETPVPHKRIVVDLESRYLVAYENGQIVFEWSISIGVENAPTSPGIYQILSHEEHAFGSSNTLCNNAGVACGQWDMTWFMGIYEIQAGLVNGFHGKVLLPNGGYLGNNAIGEQITFGCVMSGEDEAKMLYDWAELGTIVEILSREYAPMSDLGRATLERISNDL